MGAAPAAASGGPLIPSGVNGSAGVADPGGEFNYAVLGFKKPVVERITTADGSVDQWRQFDGTWSLPAVTVLGDNAGLSADGRTLVLIESYTGSQHRDTSFRVLDTQSFKTRERLRLEGPYSFDALSPDGRLMYVVDYESANNPLDYRVRAYDLEAGRFLAKDVVDPSEPDEQMSGQPVKRRMSPDGRWAYTLYGGGDETFIHALDTQGATAVCVDLDEINPNQLYSLGLRIDDASGELTVLEKGEPVAAVDPSDDFAVSELSEPASSAADASSDGSGGGDWVGPLAIGAGVALLAATALMAFRHRRRTA